MLNNQAMIHYEFINSKSVNDLTLRSPALALRKRRVS